jgi:stage V sporulation protein B
LALAFVGIGKSGSGCPSVGNYLAFATPIFVGQVLLNVLFQSDALLLRRFASDAALASGQLAAAADPLVGAYRAAQLFCFLPYQLLLSVTFILFPLLANAHRDGDRQAVKDYVEGGVRLAAILMGLMVSVTSGLDGQLIALVYTPEFAELGGRPMSILSLGLGAFALFGILTSVLNSLKHELMSLIVTGLAVLLVGSLCFALARGSEFGPNILWNTALATAIGLLAATLVAAALVKRATGGLVPAISLARVGGAMLVAISVGRWLPDAGKVMTLVFSALVAGVYLVLLLVSRELGAQDLANIRAVISRKKT